MVQVWSEIRGKMKAGAQGGKPEAVLAGIGKRKRYYPADRDRIRPAGIKTAGLEDLAGVHPFASFSMNTR